MLHAWRCVAASSASLATQALRPAQWRSTACSARCVLHAGSAASMCIHTRWACIRSTRAHLLIKRQTRSKAGGCAWLCITTAAGDAGAAPHSLLMQLAAPRAALTMPQAMLAPVLPLAPPAASAICSASPPAHNEHGMDSRTSPAHAYQCCLLTLPGILPSACATRACCRCCAWR